MAQKGNQISFRPDVKVVDCTVRDGGLVNNFYFEDKFVKDLYKANVEAGVDYMEFGYKASSDVFDEKEFGKWKFCKEEDIRSIVGDNDTDLKISVMADVGRTNFKKDIIDRKDSVIDLIRIATYINTIPAAIEMVNYCVEKGYETSVNIMAVSTSTESDIDIALELLGQSKVDTIYLVDSYGSMYPEQMTKLAEKYVEVGEKYNKTIGIHAHNNQQLAFANTIECMRQGVSFLDATMSSLGRGAGNCAMELLMGFLKNPKYSLTPILKFIQNHILKLRAEGLVWGFDMPYMLTGQLNQHPRSAIAFIKEKRTDYTKYQQELLDNE